MSRLVAGQKVLMVHPMLVVENGKLRLCDDLRFTNGFQARGRCTRVGSARRCELLTKDLQKAYHKVMMTPRAREYQNSYGKGKFYQM